MEYDHNIHGSFEFLERFGQDCAGAVIISPNENFSYRPGSSSMKEIDIEEIYAAISKKKSIAEVVSHMEKIMDKHPRAKIPKRISTLIAKRAKGLRQQGE
ncbi:hypothetical protein Lsan_2138 [Legionella santicrucis]|uniref:Uncharacterized protein n=1 Tax=Legionella santicrucis TaxID=45074 RepID=A0A0W0YSQ1_9GAMM|nr:hypothetical protein Lsan_2138 [Legionella santicrucis]